MASLQLVLALCGVEIGGLTAGAVAAEPGGSLNVGAVVPPVCDISAQDFVMGGSNGQVTGYVREFCNTTTGYQIFASYRPLLAQEHVTVRYGDENSTFRGDGMSALAFRDGPRFRSVPVTFHHEGLQTNLAVGITVMAI